MDDPFAALIGMRRGAPEREDDPRDRRFGPFAQHRAGRPLSRFSRPQLSELAREARAAGERTLAAQVLIEILARERRTDVPPRRAHGRQPR